MTIKQKVIQGIAWRGIVDVSNLLLQIIFTAILARLLGPKDFGLVAMALLVAWFLRSFTQVGFGSAIVQSQDIKESQISALFIIHLTIAALVTLLCYFSAPLAASFFNEEKLTSVLQVMCWYIFISSFSFPEIILTKNLNFRAFSILELFSLVVANAIAIWLAFHGHGVWCLVYRLLIQRGIYSVLIWKVSSWRPVKPEFRGTRSFFHFGLNMLGSKLFNYFSQNLPGIVIGKLIGTEVLGAYNIAYNLAIMPAKKIQSVLTTVLFPAFSTMQKDTKKLQLNYAKILFLISVIFVPIMAGFASVADIFILVVYGEKWTIAGGFLQLLCFIGMTKGIEHYLRSVILAQGKSAYVFIVTVIEALISAPIVIYCAYHYDAYAVIITYLLISIMALIIQTRFIEANISAKGVTLKTLQTTVLSAAVMFICVVFIEKTIHYNSILKIGSLALIGATIYLSMRYYLLSKIERNYLANAPLFGKFIKKNNEQT